jgi:hypothetical protein
MHRSGTSLLTYLLHRLGGALPKDLIGPGAGNPWGHWESRALVDINDDVLKMLGQRWDDPRPIDSAWFNSRDAALVVCRIAEAIHYAYGDEPLLLIKDPRICRLTPLYLSALSMLDIEPAIVLQLRPCEEVISSLIDRDSLSADLSEQLWIRSVIEAERVTRAYRRAWVTFDQLFADWQEVACHIADRLELEWVSVSEDKISEIDNFIDPVKRYRTPGTSVAEKQSTWLTQSVWNAVQQAISGEELAARKSFDLLAAALQDFDRLYGRSLSRISASYEAKLAAIYGSTSWQLTKPLRSMKVRMFKSR